MTTQIKQVKYQVLDQVFLVGPGSNTSDIKAGELDSVGKKDVCQRRFGQSWN